MAAFDPTQPRDKRGRWIEIGALVTFTTGQFTAGEKTRIGRVESFGQSGPFIREGAHGEGEVFMPDPSTIEVVDEIARLDLSSDPAMPSYRERYELGYPNANRRQNAQAARQAREDFFIANNPSGVPLPPGRLV